MMNMRNKLFYIIIVIVLTMSNVLANTDIVRADSLYVIRIKIKNNHMYIYEFDQAGNISLKKDMACSPCMNQKADGLTRTITYKEEWKATNQGTYVRYANDFDGDISISSVPYKGISYDSLDANKYNLLGNSKNTINVWVSVRDAKWIYDNCQVGTQVQIDDKSEALNDDMEKAIKLNEDNPNSGWDPTDEDANNPWSKCKPKIEGTKNIQTIVNKKVDLLEGVKAYDTCGNDITNTINVMGNYDFGIEGDYNILYYVKDSLGQTANTTISLNVQKIKSSYVQKKDDKNTEKTTADKLKVIIFLGVAVALFIKFVLNREK